MFFSERYHTRVIRLLFYVRPRSNRPKYLLRRLLLLLLFFRSCPFPITCKLYAAPLMLACLLRRWCLALQTVRLELRRTAGRREFAGLCG